MRNKIVRIIMIHIGLPAYIMNAAALLDQVLTLQVDERALFAQRIWESIEHFVSSDVEQAWLAEAEQRWREIEEGNVHGIPAEEAMKQARSSIRP